MNVLISMALAVLIWSLYPLAAVDGLNDMNGFELIFATSLVSSIAATMFFFAYFTKTKRRVIYAKHKEIFKTSYISIIGAGLTGLLCHTLFFVALSMSHKGGVSLIYESWPIIAVIATPFLMKKQWNDVGLKEFLMGIIALIGVIIIVVSNEEVQLPFADTKDLNSKTDYVSILGYVVALIGAYACALGVVLKGVASNKFEGTTDKIGLTLIGEIYSRLIAFAILLLSMPFLYNYIDLNNIDWIPAIYIGLVVMAIGGTLYTYALINTDRPTIHVMYYFVPIFAVFWLWVAGETKINAGLFIGGALIVAANVYLYFAGRKAKVTSPYDAESYK